MNDTSADSTASRQNNTRSSTTDRKAVVQSVASIQPGLKPGWQSIIIMLQEKSEDYSARIAITGWSDGIATPIFSGELQTILIEELDGSSPNKSTESDGVK